MTITQKAVAGSTDSNDILIMLEPWNDGVEVELKSTVARLYGTQIRNVICQTLSELGVTNVKVTADDHGALDYTIRARVKTAVYRAEEQPEKGALVKEAYQITHTLRRSLLYVPGNNPGMLKDAGIYGADCILFDLEDSISMDAKDSARYLVVEALNTIDYGAAEVFVRINDLSTQWGKEDLKAIVSTGKANIRLPKVESADEVIACDREISRLELEAGIPHGSTRMMLTIESAKGVLNAQSIAEASPRLVAIAIGGEDFVTDLKTTRSSDGFEMLFARSMILLAARAAGVDAIDTVYSNVNDENGLRDETQRIKRLGFDGKSVINPRQIAPVHEVFAPTQKSIESAQRVIAAMEEAEREHKGVISLDGKMIDKPVLMRAQRVLDLAAASGLLTKGEDVE